MMENNKAIKQRVRISFAAHLKPVPVAGFIFDNENSVKTLSRLYHYRKPRIVEAKAGWYIEYYYRVPDKVKHLYDNLEWMRFRITEDMNRRKGKDREEYAKWLRDEIEDSLKKGYNPFIPEQEYIEKQESSIVLPTEMSATDALKQFLSKWAERGNDANTITKYKRYVNRLIEWLELKRIPYINIKEITTDHIEQFLQHSHTELKFSNREYNNSLDFIRTAFNYLVKKKFISENPCLDISKKKAKVNKHRYYDSESLKKITKVLTAVDPYTYLACQVVYYLCVRSQKELKSLKIESFLWDQDKVYADAEGTKASVGRYIPMDKNIKKILLDNGIDKYPPDYYLFSPDGRPGTKSIGNGFFSDRFRKIRKDAWLPTDFTIYGFKHTRIIHLKQDGATDADIMSLTGHTNYESYAKYLRDLGLDADAKKINVISRKV